MELTENDIKRFQKAVSNVSPYNFCNYSYNSFYRRIDKILSDYKIGINELIDNVCSDYNYLERVVRDITVNTTELFRDVETWAHLRNALSTVYADKPSLNIWHAGCSTGQEVYSMMMMLSELGMLDRASIYATDINENVLNTAMNGRYKLHEISDSLGNFDKVFNTPRVTVDPRKYMELNKFKDYMQMSKSLMEKPLFLKHDLVTLSSIADCKFDLIFCRNVLIYFNHMLQTSVINFFANQLSDNGCLVIGRHEGMIGQSAAMFNKTGALYFKIKKD
ncbi:MAG: hypothetical protein MJZ66_07495 [Bacteroidales bacterium]|nr:hypothetical protein [Bacteroidales bacterium]